MRLPLPRRSSLAQRPRHRTDLTIGGFAGGGAAARTQIRSHGPGSRRFPGDWRRAAIIPHRHRAAAPRPNALEAFLEGTFDVILGKQVRERVAAGKRSIIGACVPLTPRDNPPSNRSSRPPSATRRPISSLAALL